jgi:hypothetical protein
MIEMARRRLQEETGMTVPGDPRIPYDQTDPMQQMGAPAQAAGPQASAMPGSAMPASALPPGAPDLGTLGGSVPPPDQLGLSGVGGDAGSPLLGGGADQPPPGLAGAAPDAGGVPGSTDDLTGNDLAALAQPIGDLQSPEDQQVAQMDAALNDPNTPPEQRAQLQQLLDLAARRRLAGLGGGGPQGGGLGV